MSPAQAAQAAFADVKDIGCVNLTSGRRIKNALSSGSLVLDLILGSGYKPGIMGTIFGPEGSGKSTLLNAAAVSAKDISIPTVFHDPESGGDPVYMRTQGIDFKFQISIKSDGKTVKVPGFSYSQPDTGEAIYRHILHTLRRMPIVEEGPPQILFLVDSFASMASEEVDEVGDGGRIADEARMHSYFLKRIIPRLRRRGAILLGSNQTRTAIMSYGGPQMEAGGNALRFYPSLKIRTSVKKVEADKLGVQTLPVIWRTTKNRAFPPFRSTDMRLILGRGIDKAYDAFYFLKQLGYLEVKSGKTRILLPKLMSTQFHDKLLSWKEFRFIVENPSFRSGCFEMLRDSQTYTRYFEHSQEATYFYDAAYDADRELELEEAAKSAPAKAAKAEPVADAVIDDDIEDQLDAEAEEYAELKKKNRQRGRKPANITKAEDHANQDLEEESLFED